MAGIDAFGTQWQIHNGETPGEYATVAEVSSAGVLSVSAETFDTTSHDSPEGYREHVGGLKDGGDLSVEVNFDPALHASLMDLLGVTRAMKIILPPGADDAEIDFDGIITEISGTAPVDDKLAATLTVKVSGPTTVTPGT